MTKAFMALGERARVLSLSTWIRSSQGPPCRPTLMLPNSNRCARMSGLELAS